MNLNHLEPIEPERIDYLLHQQHLYQAAKPELLGQYEVVGVGGGQMQGLGCYVDLSIGTRHFSAIRAYACRLVDLNGHAIIGRDVLNQ